MASAPNRGVQSQTLENILQSWPDWLPKSLEGKNSLAKKVDEYATLAKQGVFLNFFMRRTLDELINIEATLHPETRTKFTPIFAAKQIQSDLITNAADLASKVNQLVLTNTSGTVGVLFEHFTAEQLDDLLFLDQLNECAMSRVHVANNKKIQEQHRAMIDNHARKCNQDAQTKLTEIDNEVSRLRCQIADAQPIIAAQTTSINTATDNLAKITKEHNDLKKEIDDLQIELTSLQENLGKAVSAINSTNKSINELLNNIRKAESRIQQIKDRLRTASIVQSVAGAALMFAACFPPLLVAAPLAGFGGIGVVAGIKDYALLTNSDHDLSAQQKLIDEETTQATALQSSAEEIASILQQSNFQEN